MAETTLIARNDDHSHYEAATSKSNFDGEYTASSVIVTLAVALALYNSLEMALLISTTFKKFRGLYFWSLTLCNLGVIGFALGMMLGYFELCVQWLWKVILDAGWVLMILFQALVLYSRLGLIYDDQRILSTVKWMIVFTSTTLLIPVVVLDFGTTYSSDPAFSRGYFYIEQIMMVGITVQELAISGLYVVKTIQFLKVVERENTRSMIWQLFAINIIIICMDIAIIVLQFMHYQLYQESIKVFVYSVKLKLELNILSKLVDLVHGGRNSTRSMTLDVIDDNAIQGQARHDVNREMHLADPGGLGRWFGGSEDIKGGGGGGGSSSSSGGSSNSGMGEKLHQVHSIDYGMMTALSGSPGPQRRISTVSPKSIGGETDEISQVLSTQSDLTSRTKGRESDLMYADMLRSMR